jgi:hypothetical protein
MMIKSFHHLSFIFLALILLSLSIPNLALADQIVLSWKEGEENTPLILDGQQIIIQNDKEGFISWDKFRNNYTLVKINDTWVVLEGSSKTVSLKEFQRTELEKLITEEQKEEIQKSVVEFNYKEDYNIDEYLKPLSSGEYEKYIDLLTSPIILYLIAGLIIIICVGAWTGVEIAGLSLILYAILGVVISILPLWILITVVLGSAGILAYKLSKGISGGGEE